MNKIKILTLFILCLSIFSCTDFLDINDDPNNPLDASLSFILPSIQVNMAGAAGVGVQSIGNYPALYVHHTVQRGVEENFYAFQASNSGVATPWRIFNTFALNDIEQLLEKAQEQESGPYLGVGTIMKAYIYSLMVDAWGDIPFNGVQQGALNLSPAFDDDAAIYDSLLVMLDQSIIDLEKESIFTPSEDDLIYGGDLSKWRKFAKTLKLKLYNQIRLVRDVSNEVNALISEDDMISSSEDDFELHYGTSIAPDNRNPAYSQEYAPGGARNYVSPYFFEILSGLNTFHDNDIYLNITDPRVPYYFYNQLNSSEDPENPCSYCPDRSGTNFLSIWMFSFNADPNEGFDQSSSQTIMGLYPVGGKYDDGSGADANFNGVGHTPQRMLTYYARKYIEAELAITGVSNGDADSEFELAMQASFDKVNELASEGGAPSIVDSLVTDYIENVTNRYSMADMQGKLEHIMTQKWIATYGNSMDAYTDYRRTGFPKLHRPDTDNLPFTESNRSYPVAFPYPQDELNRNASAPSQRNITNDGVFWDQ